MDITRAEEGVLDNAVTRVQRRFCVFCEGERREKVESPGDRGYLQNLPVELPRAVHGEADDAGAGGELEIVLVVRHAATWGSFL